MAMKVLGKPIVIKNDHGENILEEEDGKEIQYTKDFGCGIDVHNKFLQVSVLVKRNLSVFEYRHEFNTDWDSVLAAKD